MAKHRKADWRRRLICTSPLSTLLYHRLILLGGWLLGSLPLLEITQSLSMEIGPFQLEVKVVLLIDSLLPEE
jgi:hypothetical protein